MLAGARGNLQRAAALWDNLAKHIEDGLLVAVGCGAEIGLGHGEGVDAGV